MTNYKRNAKQLEEKAVLWWPEVLRTQNENSSIVPKLLQTQCKFLSILCLCKDNPLQVFDVIEASNFPANLFLKHLCVLADYGGEPIKRLNKEFDSLFKSEDKYSGNFVWNSQHFTYEFKELPIKNMGNEKLYLDGKGIAEEKKLTDLYKDMIVIMLYGATSDVSGQAGLERCEIGLLLGNDKLLQDFIKQRYIVVSRITSGADANTLGQLAQSQVANFIKQNSNFEVLINYPVKLDGYNKTTGMPFDIVVKKGQKLIGIEVSFQVTTNSTIERKSGQAANRHKLMHDNGYKIAYIIDGSGNFERMSAISVICNYSDCTVAYSEEEFKFLLSWLEKELD